MNERCKETEKKARCVCSLCGEGMILVHESTIKKLEAVCGPVTDEEWSAAVEEEESHGMSLGRAFAKNADIASRILAARAKKAKVQGADSTGREP